MAWLAVFLALVMPTAALAQQRTIYRDGKVIGRESTGTDGASTFYDSTGRAVGRSSTSSSGTTTYFDARGRKTGTVTETSKPAGR
jgi:hypothetical protein